MSKKNFFLFLLLIKIIIGEEQYYIKIKETEYQFEFVNTEAANQIKSKLPFTITMTNLNGNEVYYYFTGETFTTNIKSVETINMGDIYLFQSNCLVLFYKTFSTSYSYTQIGRVINPSGLDTLIGSSNIEVQWIKKNTEDEKETTSDTSTKETQKEESQKETTMEDDTTSETKKVETDDNFGRFSSNENIKSNYIIWLFLVLMAYY